MSAPRLGPGWYREEKYAMTSPVKAVPLIFVLSCLMLTAFPAAAETDPALREDGVLYLEDDIPQKVTAVIKATTTLYMRRDFQTALAVLYSGQTVEVVGFSPDGYLLKGTARNNTVVGWIRPEDLPTGFDSSVFALAKKTEARRAAVTVAITNKTVIEGMTPEEVKQAVGPPTQTSSRTDAHGSSLAWIFTTYREEPQYSYAFDTFGRPVLQTYYVKIPIGRLIVNFTGGVVSSTEQNTTDPNSPGVVTN